MLDSSRKGFAVMSPSLKSYSFEHEDFERCKEWCRNGDVIAEQIPKCHGFGIRIYFMKFHRKEPFKMKYGLNNILWLHWTTSKVFFHKTGKIVYKSEKTHAL